jgi:hypothetical protein
LLCADADRVGQPLRQIADRLQVSFGRELIHTHGTSMRAKAEQADFRCAQGAAEDLLAVDLDTEHVLLTAGHDLERHAGSHHCRHIAQELCGTKSRPLDKQSAAPSVESHVVITQRE